MITKVGNHKVQNQDVMLGIRDLMGGEKADIFYSDPPWGVGNLSYWQTKNIKDTGAERTEQNLDAFLNQIFSLAEKYAKNMVFIEYGIRWEQQIKELGESYGLKHIKVINLRYRSGSKLLPLHLHIFAKKQITLPQGYVESVTDTYGIDTLYKALEPFAEAGKIILDPCCGMGYTAQVGIDNGMIFRGNELNAKRLQKTIVRLEKNESKK